MRTRISRSLLDEILAAAAAEPGHEICGLLFGSDGRIDGWRQTANVAAEPARRFEIDPAALFQALRAERGGGARLAGYAHSHPSGDPRPSACDTAAAAADGRLWLIVGRGEARLWRSEATGFVEVEIDGSDCDVAR